MGFQWWVITESGVNLSFKFFFNDSNKNFTRKIILQIIYICMGRSFIYCFCIQPCFEVLLILPFRIASLYRLTWYKSRNVSWRWPSRRCGTGSIRIVPATTVKSWRQSSAKTRLKLFTPLNFFTISIGHFFNRYFFTVICDLFPY